MNITNETIENVAAMVKIELTDEEKEQAKKDLTNILSYMETLNELNTDHIEPMTFVSSVTNVFREDVVTNEDNREGLLSNAPKQKDGCFMVPKTVE